MFVLHDMCINCPGEKLVLGNFCLVTVILIVHGIFLFYMISCLFVYCSCAVHYNDIGCLKAASEMN